MRELHLDIYAQVGPSSCSLEVGGTVRCLVVGALITLWDQHGVSTGWSSSWHCTSTGLSGAQCEQIPNIFGVWPFGLTASFWSVEFSRIMIICLLKWLSSFRLLCCVFATCAFFSLWEIIEVFGFNLIVYTCIYVYFSSGISTWWGAVIHSFAELTPPGLIREIERFAMHICITIFNHCFLSGSVQKIVSCNFWQTFIAILIGFVLN